MLRLLLAIALFTYSVSIARAHFVFIVPDAKQAEKVMVVFSDQLKPDSAVDVQLIAGSRFVAVTKDGKETEVKATVDKDAACLRLDLAARGVRSIVGTTQYGVFQRGEGKPFLLRYASKLVIGNIAKDNGGLGNSEGLEVVPVVQADKIRFQARYQGKPLAKAEMAILVPGANKMEALIADEQGFTKAFSASGMYGVRALSSEDKAGEDNGKKYEQIRTYATLVVTFQP